MLRLLNNLEPLTGVVANKEKPLTPEQHTLDFVMGFDDESFLLWLKEKYNNRIVNVTDSMIRQFLDATYRITVGAEVLDDIRPFTFCETCRYDEIRPNVRQEVGDWSGWSKMLDHINR